jgi:putative sterol carrier protein
VNAHVVFSDSWAQACAGAINASAAYRQAARTWEGAIMLVMLPEQTGGERRIWLDLWHGECRSARAATAEDEPVARYILTGSRGAWQQVLEGRVPPLMALLTGRLQVAKGSLAELVPHVASAKELVAAAASVPAAWPEAT